MTKTINERGFAGYCDFKDTYGGRVRVYESSADPLDKVWVNIDSQLDILVGKAMVDRVYVNDAGDEVVAFHPQYAASRVGYKPLKAKASAHLNIEQAKALVAGLSEWIEEQSR